MDTPNYTEIYNLDIAKKLRFISIEDYLRLCDKENTEENQLDCQSRLVP